MDPTVTFCINTWAALRRLQPAQDPFSLPFISIMEGNCALTANGDLKEASEIEFYNSETDTRPITAPPVHADGAKRTKRGMYSCIVCERLH